MSRRGHVRRLIKQQAEGLMKGAESAHKTQWKECCGGHKDSPHEPDCRHAWRNDPEEGVDASNPNRRTFWGSNQKPGAVVEMNYGQDYVAAKDGSLRRAVGKIATDPESGEQRMSIVIVRKPGKAELKQLKRIRRRMRERGQMPQAEDLARSEE